MELLQFLFENKEVLFGKFSVSSTKESKAKLWKEIHGVLKEKGEPVKDVTHLRVVTWDNMRKRVMAKAKKLKKTGEEGAI